MAKQYPTMSGKCDVKKKLWEEERRMG